MASSELPVAELPTMRDVLGKCSAEKDNLHRNSRVAELLPVVVKSVRELFTKVNSNLVLHSDKIISQRIKKIYEEMKHTNRSKTSALATSKFDKMLGKVFDVLVCTCKNVRSSLAQTLNVTSVTLMPTLFVTVLQNSRSPRKNLAMFWIREVEQQEQEENSAQLSLCSAWLSLSIYIDLV